MARKNKVGIDYFSHDVDMCQDIRIRILKAKFGLLGYAIFLRLLEEIYRDKGYYLILTDEFSIIFCDDNKIDINVYNDVINVCINQELFNIKHYNVYKILTSKRIQINYLEASSRRKEVFIEKSLLISDLDYYKFNNVNINEIDVYINRVNDNICTQSKVKESKVKESKEKVTEKRQNVYYSDSDIDEIYSHYPKKQGKAPGIEKLKKIKLGDYPELTKEKIIDAIGNYKDYILATSEAKYFKNFSTWVHNHGWGDTYEKVKPKTKSHHLPPDPTTAGLFERAFKEQEERERLENAKS